MFWLINLVGFFAVVFLTGIMRRFALNHMMDLPNQRSSHSIPTPRGGGLGFVVVYLSAMIFGNTLFHLTYLEWIAFTIPLLIIGILGFLDDKYHLSSLKRFLWQTIAASIGIVCLGVLPSLVFGTLTLPYGLLFIGTLFYLLWLINLFNFMDGINGLAAFEACFVFGALACLNGFTLATSPLLAFFACLAAGFLFWNFPKAKIFMGDGGSLFLGLSLGLITLYVTKQTPHYLFVTLILLGIFIVDATYTLLVRFIKKEPIFKPHRSHAYQVASLYFASHTKVTLAAQCINLFWLLPWAFLVARNDFNPYLGLAIAYLPLLFLVMIIKSKISIDKVVTKISP